MSFLISKLSFRTIQRLGILVALLDFHEFKKSKFSPSAFSRLSWFVFNCLLLIVETKTRRLGFYFFAQAGKETKRTPEEKKTMGGTGGNSECVWVCVCVYKYGTDILTMELSSSNCHLYVMVTWRSYCIIHTRAQEQGGSRRKEHKKQTKKLNNKKEKCCFLTLR